MAQGLLDKSLLAYHACGKDARICCKEVKVLQIEPGDTLQEIQGNSPSSSGRSFDQST
jgi:hypothetical protein